MHRTQQWVVRSKRLGHGERGIRPRRVEGVGIVEVPRHSERKRRVPSWALAAISFVKCHPPQAKDASTLRLISAFVEAQKAKSVRAEIACGRTLRLQVVVWESVAASRTVPSLLRGPCKPRRIEWRPHPDKAMTAPMASAGRNICIS
jgi:hypothetical protein